MSRRRSRQSPPASRSAALSYAGQGAPVLVAKGSDASAERIVQLAKEHDIPIVQDARLTALLCELSLGDEIPPSLYVAVAEVLAFVYRLNSKIDEQA